MGGCYSGLRMQVRPSLEGEGETGSGFAATHALGQWTIDLADEDGQTTLEKRLTALIGAAGGRVHLGRSRNDQVLTALRLYLRDAVRQLADAANEVANALDRLAAREGALAIPGYTHMQRAQPVLLAHHLLAYVTMFSRDAERLQRAHAADAEDDLLLQPDLAVAAV